MRLPAVPTLLVLMAAGASLMGCGRQGPPGPPGPSPAEVDVAHPIRRQVTDYEEFSGRTEAEQTVELRARVTGYLKAVHFKDGAEVKKDDLLFEIDDRPYRADLAKAEANLVQARAHLKRLESDYRRALNLRAQGAMGREEFDRMAGDRAESEATVQSAIAARDSAQLNVDYTRITAPFYGRIGRTYIDPGNLVQANTTALTTIVTVKPIKAYFDSDERTVLKVRRKIREGEIKSATEERVPVFMGLADEEDKFPHEGFVDFVDNKVDPNTGTLRIRGEFPNPGNVLTPGLFVRVRVPIGHEHEATLISDRALSSDQGRKFVFIVKKAEARDKEGKVLRDKNGDLIMQDVAEPRDVQTGALQEGGLRVIEKKGLSVDDLVIVSGLQRVRPGAPVISRVVSMESLETAGPAPAPGPSAERIEKTAKPELGKNKEEPSGRHTEPGKQGRRPGK